MKAISISTYGPDKKFLKFLYKADMKFEDMEVSLQGEVVEIDDKGIVITGHYQGLVRIYDTKTPGLPFKRSLFAVVFEYDSERYSPSNEPPLVSILQMEEA